MAYRVKLAVARVLHISYTHLVPESEKKPELIGEKDHTIPNLSSPIAEQSSLRGTATKEERKPPIDFSAWQLAWELGYTIAIPIVLLALLGRWADRMLGTSPWLLLLGVLLSTVISSFIVYRKISRIL